MAMGKRSLTGLNNDTWQQKSRGVSASVKKSRAVAESSLADSGKGVGKGGSASAQRSRAATELDKSLLKTRMASDSLIKKYGSDAPKSRGFMAYEKPTKKKP